MKNKLESLKNEISYIMKVEKINQSITVLSKDNKNGKKTCKELKKIFRGGIDGFNNGAAFVGLIPFGSFSVKLLPNDNNQYYVAYNNIKKGYGLYVDGFFLVEFLENINALKRK